MLTYKHCGVQIMPTANLHTVFEAAAMCLSQCCKTTGTATGFCMACVMARTYTLLELGPLEVLLHLEAGEVGGLASVLLEVLPVFSLLALPQLESKLQLQGGR